MTICQPCNVMTENLQQYIQVLYQPAFWFLPPSTAKQFK